MALEQKQPEIDNLQDKELTVESPAQELIAQSDSQLPQVQSTQTLMLVIEKVAAMPEMDMDRIERLFEMNERMIKRQAETEYNAAMARAQGAMQSVATNKQNDHTKSGFANLEAVHTVCKPIWTHHGFSVSSTLRPSKEANHIMVACEVRHSSGFKQVFENDWPLDLAGTQGKVNKTAIQAMGSTSTYARRYTELMIFDIAIKHEDQDGNQPKANPGDQTLTKPQIDNLRNAMKMASVSDADFCKKAQIQRVEDLQQGRLQGSIRMLKNFAQGGQQ